MQGVSLVLLVALTACSSLNASMPAVVESVPTNPVVVETLIPPTETLIPTLTSTIAPTFTASPTTEILPSPTPTNTASPTPEPVGPAIILFIGDGMGAEQRKAARWYLGGQEGALIMDGLPVQGFAQTATYDGEVTDSAASGTAIATGVKTVNTLIGLDPFYHSVPTILEQAKQHGWSVGLVTTVQMAHATPATFAAHVQDREYMLEIARQMIVGEVDVLLGGGEDEFLPGAMKGCYPEPGERGDGSNLVLQAQEKGYTYVCTADELTAVDPASTTRLLGLFADEGMLRPFSPSLPDMTRKAIEVLSQNPNGFFLMVEGGQIDWAAEDNEADKLVESMVMFDGAVAVGQVYAILNPQTLMIVTADHESGGMQAALESSGSSWEDVLHMPDGTPFYVNWTTGNHTGVDVPTSAQGPYSEMLQGVYPNTAIYDAMYAMLTGQ